MRYFTFLSPFLTCFNDQIKLIIGIENYYNNPIMAKNKQKMKRNKQRKMSKEKREEIER